VTRTLGPSALLLVALAAQAAAAEPDWAAAGRAAAELLAGAIRIDTTNPPGAELPAARHFARFLAARGLAVEVVEPAPGRGSVIARLPATAPDGSGAILLLSHLDVVPADATAWRVPPLSGQIRDGAVWGRGALDDKGQGAVFAEALALLAASEAPRRRDLVFCASADEEVGGAAGVGSLIERRWDALGPPALVWNEGGASAPLEALGGVVANGIATTEKRALWLTLVAEGEGGHGSQPVANGANDRLVRALARVSAWETPLRLTPTVAEQLDRLGAQLGVPWSLGLAALQLPGGLALGGSFLTEDRLTNAMVRDTVALTGLRSGLKHNVIPGRAEATLDVRILPDTDARAFLQDLAAVIDDPGVRVVLPEGGAPPPNEASPWENELFQAIASEMERELPGSVTLPVQATGGTDSEPFRRRGVPAYGYLPALLSAELNRTIHGNDERFPLTELERAVRVTTRVLERLVVPNELARQGAEGPEPK
jgi:acetylornithine deacetylase/succinyl-diaminopimelate desuccinylase-like protein